MNYFLLPAAIAHHYGNVADISVAPDGSSAQIMSWQSPQPQPTQAELEQLLAEYDPQPRIEPNWAQFRAQILIHSAYLRIATASPITQTLNAALVWLLGDISQNPETLGDFAAAWNQIALLAEPTATEVEQLNGVLAVCNMPFSLNGQGFMELS